MANAAKVQTALKLSQEDQNTIASLKREIEKAWKMVDAAHENEQTARWYAIPGTRYEYLLENLAEGADVHEAIADRVQKLSISAHNAIGVGEKRSVVPELDFATPPRKHARLHYMINLETARGFGPNPIYIVYYALAVPGWKLLPHCTASAVTQTSNVRGEEELAVELTYHYLMEQGILSGTDIESATQHTKTSDST